MNIKNAFAWQNRARLQLTRPRIGVTSPVFLRAANRMCQSSTLGTRTPTILNEDIDATRHQNFAPVYHGSGNNGDIIDKGSNSMKQLIYVAYLVLLPHVSPAPCSSLRLMPLRCYFQQLAASHECEYVTRPWTLDTTPGWSNRKAVR